MRYVILTGCLACVCCNQPEDNSYPLHTTVYKADTLIHKTDTLYTVTTSQDYTNHADTIYHINTGKVKPQDVIAFAQTLTDVPYKYGSAKPEEGFDCSGFITYVFNHFGIEVPRSSADFTHSNRTVSLKQARAGDLILFTGTDSLKRVVGHMGIILSNPGEEIKFIHSTSGKANGVTETPLNAYYQGRYVKAIRIFSQNN